jgi:hypothetical protein
MHEFDSVSVSTYEASSLAAKLTAKSSEGWDVVAIVPTGSDITAFLRREGGAEAAATETPAAAETAAAVTEPAGWGSAPAGSTTGSSWGSDAGATSTYGTAAASGGDTGSTWGSTTGTPAATTPAATTPSTPSVPPGWYADPAGRYELRYWDGSAWTEHVSRAGQQYTDPPVA